MRLVFASNNAHKLEEVRKIMPAGVEVLSLSEIGFHHEIEETGSTLEENSRIKAETVWDYINDGMSAAKPLNDGLMIDGVFADDTGLEIHALGGKPGVYSARWAGSPEANRAKALSELKEKEDRSAQFRTVITLIRRPHPTSPEGEEFVQVEGIVRGRIAEQEYGKGGFGYDPVFVPEGYEKTFGELPAEIKNEISHRARALQKLVTALDIKDER